MQNYLGKCKVLKAQGTIMMKYPMSAECFGYVCLLIIFERRCPGMWKIENAVF